MSGYIGRKSEKRYRKKWGKAFILQSLSPSPLLSLCAFVSLCEILPPFTPYLYPPAFPEVIGYFVSECLLVFVRQAGEQAIADVVAGVLRGFVQDVAVPEDDIACFCMQFNGLNIFDQVEIFGVFSKAVIEVIGVFAKKFP